MSASESASSRIRGVRVAIPAIASRAARISASGIRGRPLIPLAEIRAAREAIAGIATRTPLIRLEADSDADIYLKLETLQPVNSFKIRGAANAVLQASDEEVSHGVLTP